MNDRFFKLGRKPQYDITQADREKAAQIVIKWRKETELSLKEAAVIFKCQSIQLSYLERCQLVPSRLIYFALNDLTGC